MFRKSNIGWLPVSLKHPYTNIKKTVCQKTSRCNSVFQHLWKVPEVNFGITAKVNSSLTLSLQFTNFSAKRMLLVMLGTILNYYVFKSFSYVNDLNTFFCVCFFQREWVWQKIICQHRHLSSFEYLINDFWELSYHFPDALNRKTNIYAKSWALKCFLTFVVFRNIQVRCCFQECELGKKRVAFNVKFTKKWTHYWVSQVGFL